MPVITAIEFTETECRIAQGDRGRSGVQVQALITAPLPSPPDREERINARAELIRKLFRERKMKQGRVTIIIPKNFVMARMVSLPGTTDEELSQMARFETERHIPVNADKHIIAYQVLRRHGVEGSEVLLAAVDQQIASEYAETAVRAGLGVDRITVSSLSAFNALVHANPQGWRDGLTAVMNIGPACCDFILARDGLFTFTRGALAGTDKLFSELAGLGIFAEGDAARRHPRLLATLDALEPQGFFAREAAQVTLPQELSEADPGVSGYYPSLAIAARGQTTAPLNFSTGAFPAPMPVSDPSMEPLDPAREKNVRFQNWLLHLLKEARRTYEFARREYALGEINRVCLCGEGAAIRNLAPFIQTATGLPVSTFNPFEGCQVSPAALADPDDAAVAYASCAGELVNAGPEGVGVNLVPPAYVDREVRKRQHHSWIVTGIMTLALIVLAGYYAFQQFEMKRSLLDAYSARNAEMKTRVSELRAKEDRLKIIRELIQEKHGALDVLEKISTFPFIPAQVTITRVEFVKDEYLKIQGHAKTLPDVNRMRLEMEQTGFFETVTLDEGSMKPTRILNVPDQVLEYYITATFPKRAQAKSGTARAGTPPEPEADEEP